MKLISMEESPYWLTPRRPQNIHRKNK